MGPQPQQGRHGPEGPPRRPRPHARARPPERQLDGQRHHVDRRRQQRLRRAAVHRDARRDGDLGDQEPLGRLVPPVPHPPRRLPDPEPQRQARRSPTSRARRTSSTSGENETVRVALELKGPENAGAAEKCYEDEAARLAADAGKYGTGPHGPADRALHDALPQPRARGPRHDGPVLGPHGRQDRRIRARRRRTSTRTTRSTRRPRSPSSEMPAGRARPRQLRRASRAAAMSTILSSGAASRGAAPAGAAAGGAVRPRDRDRGALDRRARRGRLLAQRRPRALRVRSGPLVDLGALRALLPRRRPRCRRRSRRCSCPPGGAVDRHRPRSP